MLAASKPGEPNALTLLQRQLKRDGGVCVKCGDRRHPTVEHIVPVHILRLFDTDGEENVAKNFAYNLEVLCHYCNSQKGGGVDLRNPKTYEVMEYMLNRARDYHLKKLDI